MLGRIEQSFDDRDATEERLRQFLADASHELRTPVATVRGYAELYAAGGLDGPDALDDAMRRTLSESERMTRLIGEMLDLAKLDRAAMIGAGLVDLGLVATEVVGDATVADPGRIITVDVFVQRCGGTDDTLGAQIRWFCRTGASSSHVRIMNE